MIQNAQLSKGAKEARLPGALRPTILEWDRFAVSEGYRLAANQAKTLKFVLSRQVSFFFFNLCAVICLMCAKCCKPRLICLVGIERGGRA